MKLPLPSPEAQRHSDTLKHCIAADIGKASGWISFARFMELALYAPGQGYYAGGAHKFGPAGDFITAPELSPLFAHALAPQVAQIMACSAPHLIEVGAGAGSLATDLLLELERCGSLPASYAILELSGELRERQRQRIARDAAHLLTRVTWLERLPEHFNGLVLANELLDALPVHLVRWQENAILERGVAWENKQFVWQERPAQGRLLTAAQALAEECALPAGYLSEIGLAAADWVRTWGNILGCGALLLIDYGFPRHEFYCPPRDSGTLMCHYRHRAHTEPFFLPGLQDITAHVDFTALIENGHEAGLELLGYTTQGVFLLNCGLPDLLARTPSDDLARYLPQAQAAQKLISPAEMGELFKVMALGKGITDPLIGFASGDRSEML